MCVIISLCRSAMATNDLTALLQQLRLQLPGAKSPTQAAHAQTDLLLSRIASLSSTLRDAQGASEWNDTSRAAARLLLADLAMVAADIRGNATALNQQLAATIEDARIALERTTGDTRATPA